jgi:hypothetical protein
MILRGLVVHQPWSWAIIQRTEGCREPWKAVELPFRRLKGHQGLMRIEMTPREIDYIRAGGIPLENQ